MFPNEYVESTVPGRVTVRVRVKLRVRVSVRVRVKGLELG